MEILTRSDLTTGCISVCCLIIAIEGIYTISLYLSISVSKYLSIFVSQYLFLSRDAAGCEIKIANLFVLFFFFSSLRFPDYLPDLFLISCSLVSRGYYGFPEFRKLFR